MRHFILLALLGLLAGGSYAQQDPQYTLNSFDRLSVNPAYAGLSGELCGTMILRRQWAGFEGAPQTGLINLHGTFGSGGIGLTYFNDKLGFEHTNLLRASYSHHFKFTGGTLAIGGSAGLINKSLKPNWRAHQSYLSDPSIPDVGFAASTYDVALGVFYMKPSKMYVGLSATHITGNGFKNMNIDLSQHFYLQAGYQHALNQTWDILPSIFVKSDLASTQFDFNVRAIWNNAFWGGISYRTGDAFAPMFGVMGTTKNGSWQAGYSYDVTTSRIGNYSSGSHEVMLRYCLKLKKCDCTRYRDVRFMGTSEYDRTLPIPDCCR